MGSIGPIGANLEEYCDADTKYFLCIIAALLAHVHGYVPAYAAGTAPRQRGGVSVGLTISLESDKTADTAAVAIIEVIEEGLRIKIH